MSDTFESYFTALTDGTDNWELPLTLRGYQERQGSGHVPPGRYECVVKSANVESKKGGKIGKNIHLALETVGPKAFAKVPLHTWLPVPLQVGDTGYQKLQQLAYSNLSARGQLEAAMNTEKFSFGGKRIVNERVFVAVRDGDGEYSKLSTVAAFISKGEYEGSPGPTDNGVTVATQTATPELSNSSNNSDTISQVLFGA